MIASALTTNQFQLHVHSNQNKSSHWSIDILSNLADIMINLILKAVTM